MIKVPLWIRDLLKQDGSRTLTSDWDIGNGRMIQADKIRARDGDNLSLFGDDGKGVKINTGGILQVGYGVTDGSTFLELSGGRTQILKKTDSGNLELVDNFNDHVIVKVFKNTDIVAFPTGNVGIGTSAPGNPLAVNRPTDGIIVDFESADVVEGNVSIAGNTTSYNAFLGSHYTQLKDGQKTPPVGAIVIATGEIIHCEANIEVPVMERYYEEELEIALKDSIEDNIVEEERDTGLKQTAYVLINGKVIETQISVLETVTKVKGKKLKENFRLDEKTGKIYKKTDMVLKENEEPHGGVTVLERQKTVNGEGLTETESKEVSGIEKKEYFSYVELASQKADKRVYGVYHAKMSDDAKGQSFGEDNKAIHQIAALGLYKVRVTDTNGDIEGGDYIQSSMRAGEGERQDDNVLHNYTIAKSIVDVVWNSVEVDLELGYKWRLIPVTLHCG